MSISPDPDFELARRLLDTLRERTADGGGVTRDAYGAGEQFAHDLLRDEALKLALEVRVDGSGNLYVTLPGRDRSRPVRMTGSHLDSVPVGGNFDGAAGVIAGMAVLAGWRAHGYTPDVDVTVMGIRAEESTWFPYSYLGSKAAFGLTESNVLELCRADTGRTLREHVEDIGFDPNGFGVAELDPARIERFVELHIEQGPVLFDANIPVGIVTGIRGSFRYRNIRWLGRYAHSGAVGRHQRSDAVRAAARWMSAIDDAWEQLEGEGADLVVTVGQIMTNPREHAFSKVAGELDCCIDVRSQSAEVLRDFDRVVRDCAATAASVTTTQVDFGEQTGSKPALMDDGLVTQLQGFAAARAIPVLSMASGAGHDTAVFAQQGIRSAMIFVRNENGSHNPDEAMAFDDFKLGVRLLADTLAADLPENTFKEDAV